MEGMMRTDALLQIAREIVARVPACMAITVDHNGDASARVVNPFPLSDGWTVRFATHRCSRKSVEVEQSGRMTLAYQYDAGKAYVSLVGRATIREDAAHKIAHWDALADKVFPGGPTDPNVVYIDLVTERIELWSVADGVEPDYARGLWAASLVRDGSGWIQSTTLPGAPAELQTS
jgi:general stress protein 26